MRRYVGASAIFAVLGAAVPVAQAAVDSAGSTTDNALPTSEPSEDSPASRPAEPPQPVDTPDTASSDADAAKDPNAANRSPNRAPGTQEEPAEEGSLMPSALSPMAPPDPSDMPEPGTEIDEATVIHLNKDYGWPAGTLQEQLDHDSTLVAFGKGALFVPAMVNGIDEPPVTVWYRGKKILEANTGARIVLSPGDYFVQWGSGGTEQRFGRTVSVHEQKTSIVPITWSGLSVHVIDPQLNSLRLPYEIIRMDDTKQEYIGVGFGSDERAGEPIFTWLLQPGLYKIVRLGTSYVSRTDFATVRLGPGQHTHFLLVLDPDTGSFQGAGEARPQDLFKPNKRGLWTSLVFGGDVTATQRQGAVDVPNGNGWGFHAFFDTKFNINILDNPLLLRLQVEEGQLRLPGEPWQKQSDRLQLDLLYLYKLRPAFGPYVRGSGLVNAFAAVEYFPTAQEVHYTDIVTGDTEVRTNVQNVKIAPPWGNVNIREGAGFNVRVFKNLFGETTLRSGFGLRHILNKPGVLQDVSDATKSYHQFYRLRETVNQVGIEATVIAVARVTRWVVLNLVVDSLIPFNGINLLDLDIEGTASVKLTQYLSLNYVVSYTQFPEVYRQPIIQQNWFLRFSFGLQ